MSSKISSQNEESKNRLEQLDGLRGIAAVIVVVSHSANEGFLPQFLGHGFGQMGVTLFYALSAFLLGNIYFKQDFSTSSGRSYAISRVARVLPLFYVVLGVTLVLFTFMDVKLYEVYDFDVFLLNFFLIQGSSVLWSIPVELQYYLIFAVFWWLHKKRNWRLISILCLGLTLQCIVAIFIWKFYYSVGSSNLAFWGHIFLFGLLLSQTNKPTTAKRNVGFQSVVLLLLVLLSLPELRRMLDLPTLPNFVDPLTVGVPLLILFLALNNAASLTFLKHPFLRWLGGISFGVYLIHQPIIDAVKSLDTSNGMAGFSFILVLSISIFLSWLANGLVEIPSQRIIKRRFITKKKEIH